MSERKKILVIEDDPILLKNIKEILEEENYLVKTAVEGEQGINIIKQWNPGLIVCDIRIPNKDGYDVLTEVSKDEKTKGIPFIFLTAKVEKQDIRKGMQLGADDYIFKPFEIGDLLNSINLRFIKSAEHLNKEEKINNPQKKKYNIEDKILLHDGRKPMFYLFKNLKYLKAETPYVKLKFDSGKSILQRGSLNEWEENLPEKYFVRIHRSIIINTSFIVKMENLKSGSYLIDSKSEDEAFIASKRFSSKIKNRFS